MVSGYSLVKDQSFESPVSKEAGLFFTLAKRYIDGSRMVSQNVNNLLRQANALTGAEREQLLELLKSDPPVKDPQSPEHELAAALAEKGIKMTVPPKPTPEEIARFEAWRPIEMPGGPLSDDIVRDRR